MQAFDPSFFLSLLMCVCTCTKRSVYTLFEVGEEKLLELPPRRQRIILKLVDALIVMDSQRDTPAENTVTTSNLEVITTTHLHPLVIVFAMHVLQRYQR